MRTRAQVASTLASIGVLAIGWQVGAANGQPAAAPAAATAANATSTAVEATADSATRTATGRATTATGSATTTTTTAATRATASGLTDGTFTGGTATNRFGSVTVTITVAGGRVTNVSAASTARDGHSAQINARAIPVLKSETLSAQGASIATVSGATYTTDAYRTSLQAALDQAGA